jgi:hypothetical protein
MGCGSPSLPCGLAPPGFVPIPAWGSLPLSDIDPGVKQVTRPLLATRNSAGHGPLSSWAPVPEPWSWTA